MLYNLVHTVPRVLLINQVRYFLGIEIFAMIYGIRILRSEFLVWSKFGLKFSINWLVIWSKSSQSPKIRSITTFWIKGLYKNLTCTGSKMSFQTILYFFFHYPNKPSHPKIGKTLLPSNHSHQIPFWANCFYNSAILCNAPSVLGRRLALPTCC